MHVLYDAGLAQQNPWPPLHVAAHRPCTTQQKIKEKRTEQIRKRRRRKKKKREEKRRKKEEKKKKEEDATIEKRVIKERS